MRVQLEVLVGSEVSLFLSGVGLCLPHFFLGDGLAELAGGHCRRPVHKKFAHLHVLDLLFKCTLQKVGQRLVVSFDDVKLAFFFVGFWQIEFLTHVDQFVVFLFLHFLESELIKRSVEQHDLVSFQKEFLDDRTLLHDLFVVSWDVVNLVLSFFEASDIFFERNGSFGLGGLESQEFDEFGPVGRVVDHALLDVVGVVLVEVLESVGSVVEGFLFGLVLFVFFVLLLLGVQLALFDVFASEFDKFVDQFA